MKTHPETGEIRKMLRLAIGTRSQLCQVADGFKVIVVVEQQHAYNNLDLPLLNRFEKQVLCAEHVLVPLQQAVVETLLDWIKMIVDDLNLSSLQELFCGFHCGTLHSLVLCFLPAQSSPEFDLTDLKEEDRMARIEAMKQALTDVALPFPAWRSVELQRVSASDYFKRSANFSCAVQAFVLPRSPLTMSIFLTRSPSAHFDAGCYASLASFNTCLVQLGDVHSAKSLEKALTQFLTRPLDSILVLQCDPLRSSHAMIMHARLICEQAFNSQSSTDLTGQHHLILLVHLPPGTGMQQRHWYLDFSNSWKTAFVDDLRQSALDVPSACRCSIYDMVSEGSIGLQDIVTKRFQSALALCTSPDDAIGPDQKVHTVREMLGDVSVAAVIFKLVQAVLEAHTDVSRRSGLHLHVEMATSTHLGGTLSQRLKLAVQTIVLQALASVLRHLDANSNLFLYSQSPGLWCRLVQHPDTISVESLAQQSLLTPKRSDTFISPLNMGLHGHLGACFPFSMNVIQTISALLGTLESKNSGPGALEAAVDLVYGSGACSEMASVSHSSCKIPYLHDFVGLKASPYAQLSFEHHLQVYSCIVMASLGEQNYKNPAYIHYARQQQEPRIFNICSLLSTIGPDKQPQILDEISKCTTRYNGAVSEECLVSIDLVVAWRSVQSLWEDATETISSGSYAWIVQRERLADDIEALLIQVCLFEQDSLADIKVSEVLDYWRALQALAIFSEEVLEQSTSLEGSEVQGALERFVDVSVSACPSKLASLDLICKSALEVSMSCGATLEDTLEFIHRYLAEIVFADLHGSQLPSARVEDELLAALARLISGDISILSGVDLNSHEKQVTSLRRKLLQMLLKTPWGSDYVLGQLSIQGLGLYMQLTAQTCEVEDMTAQCDFSLVDVSVSDALTSPVLLNYIKQVQCLKTMVEKIEFDGQFGPAAVPGTGLYDLLVHTATMGQDWPRIYVLRTLVRKHGITGLYRAMMATPPEQAQWLDVELIALQGLNICLSLSITVAVDMRFGYEDVYHVMATALQQNASSTNLQDILNLYESHTTTSHDWAGFLSRMVCLLHMQGSNPDKDSRPHPKAWCDDFFTGAWEHDVLYTGVRWGLPDGAGAEDQGQLGTSACTPVVQVLQHAAAGNLCKTLGVEHDGMRLGAKARETREMVHPSKISLVSFHTFRTYSHPELQVSGVVSHVVSIAVANPGCWLHTLLLNPGALWYADENGDHLSYFPTMPLNEMATLASASGEVGWYVCRNGHPYSIGNCTQPMEVSICAHPGCGAHIGGRDHVSVKGVRKLGVGAEAFNQISGDVASIYTGYLLFWTETAGNQAPVAVGVTVLRFIMHALMLVALEMGGPNARIIATLIYPKSEEPEIKKAKVIMGHRCLANWRDLGYSLRMTTADKIEDLAATLHLFLLAFEATFMESASPSLGSTLPDELKHIVRTDGRVQLPALFRDFEDATNFERVVCQLCDDRLGVNHGAAHVAKQADAVQEHLQKKSIRAYLEALQSSMGEKLEPVLKRTATHPNAASMPQNGSLGWDSAIWSYHERVSFENFAQDFTNSAQNIASFPVLAAILDEEQTLGIVHGIQQVLEWHRLLFRALNGRKAITQEAARSITNIDFVRDFVDQGQQDHALQVLDAFCAVFNTVLPRIENLYECQRNPFIGPNGSVDLTGTGTQNAPMDHSTPLVYSLPHRSRTGETDASGLCTIGLVQWMQDQSNQLLARFAGLTRGMVRTTDMQQAISWLTDPRVIKRRLLWYDRQTSLLPSIGTYVSQSMVGESPVLGYDLERIETDVARKLFGMKSPIVVQLHHYVYSGSAGTSSLLGRLHEVILQQPLPNQLEQQILSEVNTQHHATVLMSLLQDCAAFLISMGAARVKGMAGSTSLQDYALRVLEVEAAVWDESSSPAVNQACLKHLRALFMTLEEHHSGSALDRIDVKYRDPLPEALHAELSAAAESMNLAELEQGLENFVHGMMQESPAEWGLKMCLEDVQVHNKFLGDCEWFEELPEGLMLQHAVATLKFVRKLV